MNPLTRRAFGRGVLVAGPAMLAGSLVPDNLFAQADEGAAAPQVPARTWPAGFEPETLGKAVGRRFASSRPSRTGVVGYPEVCTWYGALEVARITADQACLADLVARFEPLFGAEKTFLPPAGKHVDNSMFGGLPLEIYILTKDKRCLELGLSYADAQWTRPDAQGLTAETRYWVDDMFMIIFLQVQAFRATGEQKYLDRAALEMASYLDKLQQPNGLFYHALDVLFFWGRGNGWFAVGMSEVLKELAADHPLRARITKGYTTMMAALARFQGADGMWRQLIDREEAWPETSCTGMFAAAMITGTRKGWLDNAVYEKIVQKAWVGVAGYVDQNGDVTSVCEGTNKFNNYAYYMQRRRRTGDLHGQAPLLWSAAALLRHS